MPYHADDTPLTDVDLLEFSVADVLNIPADAWRQGATTIMLRRAVPATFRIAGAQANDMRATIDGVVRACVRAGASGVTFGSGRSRSYSDGQPASDLVRFLKALRGELNSVGAHLLFEVLSPDETSLGNTIAGSEKYISLVDGVTMDFQHVAQDPDLASFATDNPQLIRHVHLSGAKHQPPQHAEFGGMARFVRQILLGGARPSFSFEVNAEASAWDAPGAIAWLRGIIAPFHSTFPDRTKPVSGLSTRERQRDIGMVLR